VDFRAIDYVEDIIEFQYGKNLKSTRVAYNTENLITRMYVEGIYDNLGYIGIEDANPTGLGFITNFDYYRGLGVFTSTHEAALTAYLAAMQDVNQRIRDASMSMSEAKTDLNTLWGQCLYVVWNAAKQGSTPNTYNITDRVTSVQDPMGISGPFDHEIVMMLSDGKFERAKLLTSIDGESTQFTIAAPLESTANVIGAILFMTASAGGIGAKEVAIESKITALESYRKKYEHGLASGDALAEMEAKTAEEIAAIYNGTADGEGLYAQMVRANQLSRVVNQRTGYVETLQAEQAGIESVFVAAMGDLLKDGYWNDDNYVQGQEMALYTDALDVLKEASKPEVKYDIDYVDLRAIPEYEDEVIRMDTSIHIIDAEIGLNEFCFVDKIVEYPLTPWNNAIKITNQVIDLAGRNYSSVMGRLTDLANQITGKKALFNRAEVVNSNDQISTDVLNGIIDIAKNKLLSSVSNWYTDDNGNLMFVAADGSSAMMLSGTGFMIADSKSDRGDWEWRTFGNGRGFIADEIVAGELRAGLIRILGTDRFYWDAANIYIIDPNNQDQQIRIGMYDGVNYGIGYTHDGGTTWDTAIGFDGVHFSASSNDSMSSLSTNNLIYIADGDGKSTALIYTVNVLAYTGPKRVHPTVNPNPGGNIPTGMTVTIDTSDEDAVEIPITIAVAQDALLGGVENQQGAILIQVSQPKQQTLELYWSKIKAGEAGQPGQPGQNGTSSHLHIRYSDDGGQTFTAGDGTSVGTYLGTYVSRSEIASTDPSDYIWQRMEGENAKYVTLTTSSQVFTKPKGQTEYLPATIT
jgi:hypothetical protein